MKRLTFLGVLICCLFLLGACGKKAETAKEAEDTINVWAWDAAYNIDIIKKAVKKYNQEYHKDLRVVVQDMPSADVNQKLQTILSSGSLKGLPDLVLLQDADSQKFLSNYHQAFADMTKKVDLDDFYAFKKAAVTYDGKVYGVPFDVGVTGLLYRTDLFAKAGYTAADLENITWKQFIKMGEQVTKVTGVPYYSDNVYSEIRLLQILMQSAGSFVNNPQGKTTLVGNKIATRSFQTIIDLKNSKDVKLTNDWNSYMKVPATGDTASIMIGNWFLATLMANKDQSGKWGLAPIPKLDGIATATHYSNTGGASWYVMSQGKAKQNKIIDFVNTMFGKDKEFQQQILKENNAIVSSKSAVKGSAYQEKVAFFGNQSIYLDYTKWLNQVPTIYQTKNTPIIYDSIKEFLPDIVNQKRSIKNGERAIQETVVNKIGE